MMRDEAYRRLGLRPDATSAEIRSAFTRKAKQFHPDRNTDPEAAAEFQQILNAYRALRDASSSRSHRFGLPRSGFSEKGDGSGASHSGTDGDNAKFFVRTMMAEHGIEILFDGSIRINGQQQSFGPDQEREWRNRPLDWSLEKLVDETFDRANRERLGWSVSDIRRAVRQVVSDDQLERETSVMGPLLYNPLSAAEATSAAEVWRRLVAACFDIAVALGVAILQHFIWQVKSKQLGQPVTDHLMPIIMSRRQGTGKTSFVTSFLAPLEELASAPVLLSQLADPRSGGIFRFPVVFVDDAECLEARHVPALKSLLTADALSRRQLGSSFANKWRQRATVIGTANAPVSVLIDDPTGQRRFAELPFRNGAVVTDGSTTVWQTVNETNFSLLWRSVDAFAPSPILPHLAALRQAQAAAAPVDRLKECLVSLDPSGEDLQSICERAGAPAEKLRLLICAMMREEIRVGEFSARMAVLVHDPAVPFGPKRRSAKGCFYPLKASS